jgi:hypothetical protein
MKINSTLRHALLLCVVAGAASALADEIKITLGGDQEVPPVSTKAAGSGVLTINKDMSVSGGIATTGIAGTMAHIHVGKAGANGPVAVTLNRNGDNGWVAPPGAMLTEAQYKAYLAGEIYVNVHSDAHKGGEIRGQLNPPAAAAMPRSSYGY